MKKDESIKVIFRVDERNGEKEVIAFFPSLAGDNNPYRTCLCYAHIGQHSSASIDFPQWTRPAYPFEYMDLWRELESIGYNLRISKRMNHKDFLARKEQCR